MQTLWFEGPLLPLPDSQRAEDYPQDMAGEVYQQGKSAVRAVNRQIEEQPLFTALAAFAIGYGLSYLLHGQR